jgi:hypothetical protein
MTRCMQQSGSISILLIHQQQGQQHLSVVVRHRQPEPGYVHVLCLE